MATFARPTPLPLPHILNLSPRFTRPFSTSPHLLKRSRQRAAPQTRQRKRLEAWLKGPGAVFRYARPGSTNYLTAYDKDGNLIRASTEGQEVRNKEKQARAEAEGEEGANAQENQAEGKDGEEKPKAKTAPPETQEDLQPFPLNPFFRSEPVPSLELRDEIYRRVKEGLPVRAVSQSLGVDMNRVGAVVRLKEVELDWIDKGRPLALDFRRKIMDMLPITPYDRNDPKKRPRHESINDLPVHPSTLPQLFHPAPEAAHFTREDAAKVFYRGLLPADKRIPHPDMVDAARDDIAGMKQSDKAQRREERWREEQERILQAEEKAKQMQAARTTVVPKKRWDFHFEAIQSDGAGNKGRNSKGVGWRYGMPLEDRKKAQVKIPTRIE